MSEGNGFPEHINCRCTAILDNLGITIDMPDVLLGYSAVANQYRKAWRAVVNDKSPETEKAYIEAKAAVRDCELFGWGDQISLNHTSSTGPTNTSAHRGAFNNALQALSLSIGHFFRPPMLSMTECMRRYAESLRRCTESVEQWGQEMAVDWMEGMVTTNLDTEHEA